MKSTNENTDNSDIPEPDEGFREPFVLTVREPDGRWTLILEPVEPWKGSPARRWVGEAETSPGRDFFSALA